MRQREGGKMRLDETEKGTIEKMRGEVRANKNNLSVAQLSTLFATF